MPEEFGYLEFSRGLVQFGGILALGTIFSVLWGHFSKDRRLVLVARRMVIATGTVTIMAAGGLIAGFEGDFPVAVKGENSRACHLYRLCKRRFFHSFDVCRAEQAGRHRRAQQVLPVQLRPDHVRVCLRTSR